jgi:hypothetical protein
MLTNTNVFRFRLDSEVFTPNNLQPDQAYKLVGLKRRMWRRGRDSNSRKSFPFSGLANRRTRPLCDLSVVPKGGLEPPYPFEYYALNVACLPFHHFGVVGAAFPTTSLCYAIMVFLVKRWECGFFVVQGNSTSGGDERREQPLRVGIVVDQRFGVILHRQREGLARHRDRLDQPIGGTCCHLHARAHVTNRLMV